MRIVFVFLVFVVPFVAGCGSGLPRGAGKEQVVAAFYPLAFAAERVGDGKVSVTNLTPPGLEPHDIELTPREVGRVQSADVVLYLSHGFQPAVEQALKGAHGEQVDALEAVSLRGGVGDESGKTDPHVWLDPVLFAGVVRRIGEALGERRRGDGLAEQVMNLDREYRVGLAHCARRDFVTSHAAFGYLAARYHLHQIPITGIDPEAEPSARELANLTELIRREHINTVFFETLVSPKIAQTLARETGADTAVLDPIEGLTPSEASAGDDYLSLMRRNLMALRKALDCR